jgi:ketosteroid isomerase-like protein
MRRALLLVLFFAGCAAPGQNTPAAAPPRPPLGELARQVEATERAFAKTMADRDHAAFVSFLSEETLFWNGPSALRDKQKVADAWRAYYEPKAAPFSWEPAVEVIDSGQLALSTGPVRDPAGKVIGTFNSVWRQEAPGVWRVLFDKGCPVSDCKAP